jgi:hypothetical protein
MRPSFPFLSVIGMFGRRTSKFHPVGDNNPPLLALRGFCQAEIFEMIVEISPLVCRVVTAKICLKAEDNFRLKDLAAQREYPGGMVGLL